MAKVNRKWHDKNKLPKRAATKERVKWHLEHAKLCACRPIPAKIQRTIAKLEESKPKKATKTVKKTTTKKTPKKK
jgi:hypothetical protein